MSATMQHEAETGSAAPEAAPQTVQTASFGTAFVGFMITTTLTTSIMVLLSQGG